MRKKIALTLALAAALCATTAYALVEVAGGELFIDVATSASVRSNIFSNQGEQDDVVYTFTPGLSFERKRGLFELSAYANTSILRFDTNENQDTENFATGATLNLPKREGYPWQLHTSLGYARASSPNEDIGDIVRSDVYSASAGILREISPKTAVGIDVFQLRRDYRSNGNFDTQTYGLSPYLQYAYSPKLAGQLGYRHVIYNDDGIFDPSGESNGVFVGITGELTPKITSQVRVGAQVRTYDNAGFDDEVSPFITTEIRWMPTQKTNVNWKAGHDYSTTASNLSLLTTRTDVLISHNYSQRFTLRLGAGAAKYEYESSDNQIQLSDRDGHEIYGLIGLSYTWRYGISLNTDYRVSKRSSSVDFYEYDNQSVNFGLSYRF